MDDDRMYNAEVLDAKVVIQLELMRSAIDVDTHLPREDSGLDNMYIEPDGGWGEEEALVDDGGEGGGGYVEEPQLEEEIKNIRKELGLPATSTGLGEDANLPFKKRRLLDPVTAAKYARSTRAKFNGIWVVRLMISTRR